MKKRYWLVVGLFDVALLLAGVYFYVAYYQTRPPADFVPQTFVVVEGQTVRVVAQALAEQQVVRSAWLFELLVRLHEEGPHIKAGAYTFAAPPRVGAVVSSLLLGVPEETISVTFFEGETNAQFGARAARELEQFDEVAWRELTAGQEGRLFPDTYFLSLDTTAEALFALLHDRHELVMREVFAAAGTDASPDDVRIIASILEREANSPESMALVAGIFQNRLSIDMPLQADATVGYALESESLGGLSSYQIAQNIREIDSPYNTYKYTGLPPTPIGNPGRQALLAALTPQPSAYLYYLTGTDGEFYYAETYAGHVANIERHLR